MKATETQFERLCKPMNNFGPKFYSGFYVLQMSEVGTLSIIFVTERSKLFCAHMVDLILTTLRLLVAIELVTGLQHRNLDRALSS